MGLNSRRLKYYGNVYVRFYLKYVLTNMFKTGHPTYTIAIWKIFRIYKLKVKLFIILTQNGVKTLL